MVRPALRAAAGTLSTIEGVVVLVGVTSKPNRDSLGTTASELSTCFRGAGRRACSKAR